MALLETDLPGLPKRRGKVRDVYDLGDERLLIVATDRISAFDWVLPTPIPDKGRVLTALSTWWFRKVDVAKAGIDLADHFLSDNVADAGLGLDRPVADELAGRSTIVKKAAVVPFECVVRGYLSGSGWKEYRKQGTICGEILPPGLVESDRIDPIFTPATKAEVGHDENVSFVTMENALGHDQARFLRDASLYIYREASKYAHAAGLILADTKFEFGRDSKTGEYLLIDEILTPDSSRYWPLETYRPGGSQPSFDKQFVRDYLETTGWDKQSPPPPLPEDVVEKTRAKYIECYETLTGQPFAWK